jgi:hypothetical protein
VRVAGAALDGGCLMAPSSDPVGARPIELRPLVEAVAVLLYVPMGPALPTVLPRGIAVAGAAPSALEEGRGSPDS